jgi:hypothetical protein
LSRLPGKRARPVLRGRRRGNTPPLPDEIFFSVIQRKVIKPTGFGSSQALTARLLAFQDRYNATAAPFDWKFTRAKLNDLIRRIDARRRTALAA